MAKKDIREKLRKAYMELVFQALTVGGDEVLQTGSNEFAIPCVDSEGNEDFCVITFKMPNGSRDGEPYDGYSMAQDYEIKLKQKAEKAKADAEKKAKKIERDKKLREERARLKAEREEKT